MGQNYNYRCVRERKYTDCVYQRGESPCECATCTDRLARSAAKRDRKSVRSETSQPVNQSTSSGVKQ